MPAAAIPPPLEMLEPELVLELPVLLLDRPPAADQRDQLAQRGGGGEVEQVVLPFVVDQRALTQEPPLAPALGGAHTAGREARRQGAVGALGPGDAPPRRAAAIAAAVRVRRSPGVHIVSTDRMARLQRNPRRSTPRRNAAFES
mgnify:CR=1 FL=1